MMQSEARLNNVLEVCGACTITDHFPSIAMDAISRDNYIELIEDKFSSDNRIIILEGAKGQGKTVLLSQYAKMISQDCVVAFIDDKCAWNYNAENILYDMCRQVYFYTHNDLPGFDIRFDIVFVRRQLQLLTSHLSLYKKKITFIIDGLDLIPTESKGQQDSILEALPLSCSNIRYIFSTRSANESFVGRIKKLSDITSIPLAGFSVSEIKTYLSEIDGLSDNDIAEISRKYKSPQYLSFLKNKMLMSSNAKECIDVISEDLWTYMDEELSQNQQATEIVDLILVMAFEPNLCSLEILSIITGVAEQELRNLLNNNIYITYDERTNRTMFQSELYRDFFIQHFKDREIEIKEKALDYYYSIDTPDRCNRVPAILIEMGKSEDALRYLSTERMEDVFSSTLSYSELFSIIEYGISASQCTKKDSELLKYLLLKNMTMDVCDVSSLQTKVDALFDLDMKNEAVEEALSAFTIEDRLFLLCRVARKMQENGVSIDDGLIITIRELHNRIDYSKFEESAIKIASEVVCFIPEIAMEIIEKTDKSPNRLENDLDFAFARLTIQKAMETQGDTKDTEVIRNLSNRILSKGIRQITDGIILMLKNFSIVELMREVDKMESISEKIMLLQGWLISSESSIQIIEVIHYGIQLINSETEYKPTADYFKAASKALLQITDNIELMKIIKWFDEANNSIKSVCTQKDFVSIQVKICIAQRSYDFRLAKERLLSLYFEIGQLTDLIVKTECLALVLSKSKDIDPNMDMEKSEGIFEICILEILDNCKLISQFVADHFKAFSIIITFLSKLYYTLVIQIIEMINTQYRKDRCYFVALESYLSKTEGNNIDVAIINSYMSPIIDEQIKAYLICKSCELLYTQKGSISKNVIGYLNTNVDKIFDASAKVNALAFLLSIDDDISRREKHWQKLLMTWEEIDLFTDKIETGYSVVSLMSSEYKDNATELFHIVNDFEARGIFRSSKMFLNYVLYLRNLIRSFSGLARKSKYTKDDKATLEILIEAIPSLNVKIKVYNDLSIRLYNAEDKSFGDVIVDSKIIPLLDQFVESERFIKENALLEAIVSIYIYKPMLALNHIKEIQGIQKDIAIRNICNYIMYHAVPSDPIDSVNRYSLMLKYSDYISMIELLDLSQEDSICYEIIEEIVSSINKNKQFLNKTQKEYILKKIIDISNIKFPAQGGIQHSGFRIIAHAQIFSTDHTLVNFQQLVDEAHQEIPNIADLVYVLAILAGISKKSEDRRKILEQAEEIINDIPSIYEQIEHLQILGYHNWIYEKSKGKHFFHKALEMCQSSNNEQSQRKLIDIASRIDDELAKSLIAIIDSDEGRVEARKSVQSQSAQLELRQLMKLGKTPDNITVCEGNHNILAQSSWIMLGKINARAISPIQIQDINSYVAYLGNIDSYNLYPILSWMIENSVRKYSDSLNIGLTIRPFFDNLSISLKYMLRMINKTNRVSQHIMYGEPSYHNSDELLAKPQSRAAVHTFIRDWLSRRSFSSVIICDKYFEECCLELVEIIAKVNTNCEIIVLSSKEAQSKILANNDSFSDLADIYQSYWRKFISEDSLPDIELYIVKDNNGNAFPIHDRYLVTDDSALHFGSSFNYCGTYSLTQVAECKSTAEAVIYETNKYARRERNVSSRIIRYETFSL